MAELLSVATAVPEHRVTAAQTKADLTASYPQAGARFARLVQASRIQTRYSTLPLTELRQLTTLDARNREHARHAVTLAEQVAKEGLRSARIRPDQVSAIISACSTGHMMPSLEAHLINRVKLNPMCRRVPLSQLGCSGGVGAIGLAAELLAARPAGVVLTVSVELPSLSLPSAEPSVADVLASLQFGDGAAAAVFSSQHSARGPEIVASQSVLFRETTDCGGARFTEAGLRISPSTNLPHLICAQLPKTMRTFLEPHHLEPADISFWVVHPRSPQLLEAVGESLHLTDRQLAPSRAVWEGYGNVVSASVFFILRHLQAFAPPADGDLGVMLALGAGVSCEMVLLRSCGWGKRGH